MKKQSKQATAPQVSNIQIDVVKRSLRTKVAGALLLLLAMVPGEALAETNGRSAQAVLHLQVTVMPVLMPAQQQAKAAASPVTFDLQGQSRAKGVVTRAPMPAGSSMDARQMLETTTVVAE